MIFWLMFILKVVFLFANIFFSGEFRWAPPLYVHLSACVCVCLSVCPSHFWVSMVPPLCVSVTPTLCFSCPPPLKVSLFQPLYMFLCHPINCAFCCPPLRLSYLHPNYICASRRQNHCIMELGWVGYPLIATVL